MDISIPGATRGDAGASSPIVPARHSSEVYSDNIPNPSLTLERGTDPETTTQERPTPLPWLQVSLVLLIQLAEPVVSKVIFPFVNQFVRSTGTTGGNDAKTGYFSGSCCHRSILDTVNFLSFLHRFNREPCSTH